VHQLVNKLNLDNIKMHGTNVKISTNNLNAVRRQLHLY